GTLDKPKIVIPLKFYKITENEDLNKHSESKVNDDDKNFQEIINTAISSGSLSAIIIIANGTESRVTLSTKNTLVRLSNNLPDDLLGNLLLILTKGTKSGASFSEDAFLKRNCKVKGLIQIWKDDEDEQTITELSFTSTKAFENMRDYRNKFKSEIAKYSLYPSFKDSVVCHDHCGLGMVSSSGTDHFIHCYFMGLNNKCTICNCGPRRHYHAMVKLITETKTLNKVLEDMKAQYDMANQQYQKYRNDATNNQSSLSNLQSGANAK
ncbi:1595_t:CDS:2, partial [Gigaspora rosea]